MRFIFIFLFSFLWCSCSKDFNSPSQTPNDIFETFWKYADENYVYFQYKNIDWTAKKSAYLNKISPNMSEDSLFKVCSSMLFELKDGHSWLSKGTETSKYNYSEGYEVNFDLELVKFNYLKNNFQTKGNYIYGVIQDTVGYIYYKDFNSQSFFETVLTDLMAKNVKKIVFDIRNNGGGEPAFAQNMVGYFVNTETLIGYIQHKNGKTYQDFSTKIALKATPKTTYFDKKVNVLINRKSFSASSYFAGMTHNLEKFQLIGQVTGGGGGAALSYELPNTWVVAITSNFFLDSKNNHIENGVPPDIEVNNTQTDVVNKRDKMLEKAIEK